MTFAPQYNEYDFILNNDILTKQQKIRALEELKRNSENQLNEKMVLNIIKKWLGAGIEVGSSAIPFAGPGRAGATVGTTLFKNTLGRKLSQELGSGALSGIAGGAVFGVGESLLKDENLYNNLVKYGASGLLLGALSGTAAGYAQKVFKANKLINSKPINMMTKEEKVQLRKEGKQYYKDYLQGRQIYVPYLDSVNFPGGQAGEVGLHNYKMIPRIPNQIKNSKNMKLSNDKPERLDANNFYKLYNTYKNKKYEYIFRNNSNNTGNDFYQIKEVGPNPAYSDQPRALKLEPNNIITYNDNSFNPGFKLLPAWLSSLLLKKDAANSLNNLDETQTSTLLKGSIEMNVLNNLNGGEVYVRPYTRDDGTDVRGYFRSKPVR